MEDCFRFGVYLITLPATGLVLLVGIPYGIGLVIEEPSRMPMVLSLAGATWLGLVGLARSVRRSLPRDHRWVEMTVAFLLVGVVLAAGVSAGLILAGTFRGLHAGVAWWLLGLGTAYGGLALDGLLGLRRIGRLSHGSVVTPAALFLACFLVLGLIAFGFTDLLHG